MDRELQEKLQKYGAGFAKVVEEKFLADKSSNCKGKSPAEETVWTGVKRERCVINYASPLDREKDNAIRKETAKKAMNLPNGEHSYNRDA